MAIINDPSGCFNDGRYQVVFLSYNYNNKKKIQLSYPAAYYIIVSKSRWSTKWDIKKKKKAVKNEQVIPV